MFYHLSKLYFIQLLLNNENLTITDLKTKSGMASQNDSTINSTYVKNPHSPRGHCRYLINLQKLSIFISGTIY